MAEWTLRHYRREGFGPTWAAGSMILQVRLEVVDVMIDAATAVARVLVLPDETRATLMARFIEWHGGAANE